MTWQATLHVVSKMFHFLPSAAGTFLAIFCNKTLSVHIFHAVDDTLAQWLHVTGGVQWQIQQAYIFQIEFLVSMSRTHPVLKGYSCFGHSVYFQKRSATLPVAHAFLEDFQLQR
jgi:hypothetical protein